MTEFIAWFMTTIHSWWEFLIDTDVPGTSFSFGALVLFVFVIDLGIMIVKLAMSGNTAGGSQDASNRIHEYYRNKYKKRG